MSHSQSLLRTFILFVKGILMGSADIIPGVSGGTVALIVGIYERFIIALKSINLWFIVSFFKGFRDKQYFEKSKKQLFSIDFSFLIPLLLGILVAFLTLANLVGYGLEEFPTYTFAFFFGLILASSVYVYVSHRSLFMTWKFFPFAVIGFFVSYILVGMEFIQMEHSLLIVFFSGIISICAMILPGISGAFILLMLGQYSFMLNVLRDLSHLNFENIFFAVSFGLGGLVGLMGFSRVMSFLLKKYHMQTLSFVLGLMIGALRKPGGFILENPRDSGITLGMIVIGIIIIALFSYYELLIKKRSEFSTS